MLKTTWTKLRVWLPSFKSFASLKIKSKLRYSRLIDIWLLHIQWQMLYAYLTCAETMTLSLQESSDFTSPLWPDWLRICTFDTAKMTPHFGNGRNKTKSYHISIPWSPLRGYCQIELTAIRPKRQFWIWKIHLHVHVLIKTCTTRICGLKTVPLHMLIFPCIT